MYTLILLGLVELGGCVEDLKPSKNATNNESACIFEGLNLKKPSFVKISNEIIAQKWDLVAYCDLEKCQFEKAPDSASFVRLSLDKDTNITGNSTNNSLYGNYILNNDFNFNFRIGGSKVGGETNWVWKVRSINFSDSFKVQIKNSLMILYYNDEKNAILFRKI